MDWYPVISCDSHIHEPRDLYERYLPEDLRDRGPRVLSLDEGDKIMMGDALVRWVGLEVQEEFAKEERSFKGSRYELGRRGKFEAEPRKADLAHDGVQGEVVYGFSYWMEQPDREVLLHMIRIYNDWVHETLADTADRSIAPAMLPSWDPEASVAEAMRVKKSLGARAVQVASPYVGDVKYGYASPDYDTLWATLADLELPIGTHIGSGRSSPRYRGLGATLHDFMANLMDAQDIIRDFIGAGIFHRHPTLKLAATEGGIGWAPWYVQTMDAMWEDNGAFFYPPLPEPPSFYFKRNCLITWQEDGPGIRCIDMIEDSVAWGSDYPHREGTFPNSRTKIEEQISSLPIDLQVKLCTGNAARFFGFDVDLLAKKYGPDSDHHRHYSKAEGGSVTPEMVEPVKGRI